MTGNGNGNKVTGMGGNGMLKVIPTHLYCVCQGVCLSWACIPSTLKVQITVSGSSPTIQ